MPNFLTQRKRLNLQFHTFVFLNSALNAVQFALAAWSTLAIPGDPKHATAIGLSAQRLVLVIILLGLALGSLAAGGIAFRRKISLERFSRPFHSKAILIPLKTVAFLLITWGGANLILPASAFQVWASYYERFQPLSIVLGLSVAEFWLALRVFQGKFDSTIWFTGAQYAQSIFAFALPVLGLAGLIAFTKIGLVQDTAYWNVAGIPVAGLQFFGLILLTGLATYIFSRWKWPPMLQTAWGRVLPWAIFLGAVAAWGLTPMLKHYFSLQPAPPYFQPYPFSDARLHDLGGLSILNGSGIYFYDYTDKPLYMVFLSILHIFAGYDYTLLSWLQIFVLALAPVTLFYLGKRYHGLTFGLLLAMILIVRQTNAIELSYKVASVNPRLLMTEMLTLLGIVLLTYLVFEWFRRQTLWLALLSGGVIGAAALLRLNPIFLFPAIAVLAVPVFWKTPHKISRHLALYTLGFCILMAPWVITGINSEGQPWLYFKVREVIRTRYDQRVDPASDPSTRSAPATGDPVASVGATDRPVLPAGSLPAGGQPGNAFLIFSHFLHNISTSVLALPDSLAYEDLDLTHLGQRQYWQNAVTWDGSLPAGQAFLVFVNLGWLAVGIGYSWKRYRWMGLLPLIVFLTYTLSLGIAMTSGSRYIVPVDWILYFYYLLALVLAVNLALRWFNRGYPPPLAPLPQPLSKISDRQAMWATLAGLIAIASLIPIANLVIPSVTRGNASDQAMELALKTLAVDPQAGEALVYGQVLYPTNIEDWDFRFHLLMPHKAQAYAIPDPARLQSILNNGDRVILRTRLEEGKEQVKSVYLWQNGAPVLGWERP